MLAPQAAPGEIRLEDFVSREGLTLVGDASIAGRVLRLTPAERRKSGAAWFGEKQPVRSGFETTFRFQLTEEGGACRGADGFAFVLQNSGSAALGGRGSAGGFGVNDPANPKHNGIPWSVAVFFDTCRNVDQGDPSSNYIALRTAGRPAEMRWPAARLAFTSKLTVHLKDRKVHTARIVYQAPVLSVYLDRFAKPVLETAVDLSIVMDREGRAWVGFTASTGDGYQNHDILSWSFRSANVSSSVAVVSSDITFSLSACLPDRNLCTPERAIVEPRGAGYHIILPANLEWGASIPNQLGRQVAISNAHGIVCWDLEARGSEGCGGPSGTAKPGGAGFLAPDAPAGALISKSSGGQTWFSVNGPTGDGFKNNEGFYEFDVEIK